MATPEQSQPTELPQVDEFIESYGTDAKVAFPNGLSMTLGDALRLEDRFCKADDDRRNDPARRLRYMSRILAASEVLHPDHQYLTDLEVPD